MERFPQVGTYGVCGLSATLSFCACALRCGNGTLTCIIGEIEKVTLYASVLCLDYPACSCQFF